MSIDLGTSATANAGPATTPAADLIKESSTATFQADVLDASKTVPVLVDFWAPWCGPCRQLGPAIERVVTALGGKLKLVKINVDENQALAGQMGVQSIPAVFAFVGGQPVDGFMGALPESEITKFAQKVIDGAGAAPADPAQAEIERALEAAAEAREAGDDARAIQIYELVLQHAPGNDTALIALAELSLKAGDNAAAEQWLAQLSEAASAEPAAQAVASALQLAAEAESLGSVEELESRLAADEDDHQARYDLALALNAKGFKLEAAEALVALMRRDRDWNDDAARRKLLELFEAWGPQDPATLKGRRLLSAALFS